MVFEHATQPHDVGVTLGNLAAIAHRRGDLEEAERLHRRALAIKEATLGGDHPELAITLANLATTLRAAGRPDEAVPLDRRAHALLDRAASSPITRRWRSSEKPALMRAVWLREFGPPSALRAR